MGRLDSKNKSDSPARPGDSGSDSGSARESAALYNPSPGHQKGLIFPCRAAASGSLLDFDRESDVYFLAPRRGLGACTGTVSVMWRVYVAFKFG